ncbi:Hypothetical protein FKW44_007527 [Caligus rogercresseyi]|uniref:Uncharacterized protein n=1 Tax=Caligus rogercresseyi TaxID=217165 RepID=A0A7T8QTL7_CALRO|nr:Hypothetical protein FKW44_007527 [Caligus rogercresseyi]
MLEALKEHGLTFTERKGKRRSHDELTMGNEFPRLKYRIKDELIYIHRKSLFEHLGLQKVILSGAKGFEPLNAILVNCGLSLDKAYIGSRQEMYSYMSLEAALLILDSQEPLMPHWENLISAISLEVPKLKVRVKMEAFRGELIAVIVRLYSEYIRNPKSKRVNRVELIDLVTEDEDSTSEECDFKRAKIDHFDVVHAEQFAEPSSEYESIKTQILTNSQGGMIGSWEVKRMDDELIRLIIPPGSSRKMSFIHPDVAALLSYEFLIQHDLRFAFSSTSKRFPQSSSEAL